MFQVFINYIYRYPLSFANEINSFGGLLKYFHMLILRTQMKVLAKQLYVDSPENNLDQIEICILTGRKFWYQTVFCAYSIQKVTPNAIKFHFYDDGSINGTLIKTINKQVKNFEIHLSSNTSNFFNQKLPFEKYSNLHLKRKIYPHLKKITDIGVSQRKFILQLDSDLLFFKYPEELINVYMKASNTIFMKQHINSYGYEISIMEELSKHKIKELINVGIVGINPSNINFEEINLWIAELENKYGSSYFLEQALWAMISSKASNEHLLNKKNYEVMPLKPKTENTVARHYVSISKTIYYKEAINLFKNV